MSDMSRREFVGSMAAAAAIPAAYGFGSPTLALAKAAADRRAPQLVVEETIKVFDPTDHTGFGAVTNLASSIEDVTIIRRAHQWQMIGEAIDNHGRLGFFSATLPDGAPLAATGWAITTASGDPTTAVNLVPNVPDGMTSAWDYSRHNSSYVRGWDPAINGGEGGWQERLYYTGSNASGVFAIGYLVWNGESWVPFGNNPVLTATAPWESTNGPLSGVYEPNVIYHDGKWRVWYVIGPPDKNGDMAQGYAESVDGRTNWVKKIYWPASENIFDNQVRKHRGGRGERDRFETVFARFGLSFKPQPDWGLWWQQARQPFDDPSRWSDPIQLVAAADGTPWHAIGVWKPSLHYSDADSNRAFIFFDGGYGTESFGRPFTLGCAVCRLET